MRTRYVAMVVLSVAACADRSAAQLRTGSATAPSARSGSLPRGDRLCLELGETPTSLYERFLAKQLLDGVSSHRFVQMIEIPPLAAERAVVVEGKLCSEPSGNTEVKVAQARTCIWLAMTGAMGLPRDPPPPWLEPLSAFTYTNVQQALTKVAVPVDVSTASIDCAMARKLGDVWAT